MERAPQHVRTRGIHFRVADQDWADPLDATFSAIRGGRWNAPGTFPVLYLTQDDQTARDYMDRLHAGRPYGPEDLTRPPVLVEVDIVEEDYVDASSDTGLLALGLPSTYPRQAAGTDELVEHATCQPIGLELFDADELGIVCRSANTPDGRGRELAWFDRPTRRRLSIGRIRDFDDWYWRG